MLTAAPLQYAHVTLAIGDERLLDKDFVKSLIYECTADVIRLSEDPAVPHCFSAICRWVGAVPRAIVHFWAQCAEVAYRMLVFSVPRLFNKCDMSDPNYVITLSSIAATLRFIKKCVAVTPYRLEEHTSSAETRAPTAEASLKLALQRLQDRYAYLDKCDNPLSVADMIESCYVTLPTPAQVQSCTLIGALPTDDASCARHTQQTAFHGELIKSLFNAASGFDVPMFCVIRTSWYRFMAMLVKKVIDCNTCTSVFHSALKALKSAAYHACLVEPDDAFDPSPPTIPSTLIIWQKPTSQIAPYFMLTCAAPHDDDDDDDATARSLTQVCDTAKPVEATYLSTRIALSVDDFTGARGASPFSDDEIQIAASDATPRHRPITSSAIDDKSIINEENRHIARRSTRRHVPREVFHPLLVEAAVLRKPPKCPKSRRATLRQSKP